MAKAKTDEEVAEVLQVTVRIIENIRKLFIMGGFEVALYGKPCQRTYDIKMDGDAQAHLIALSAVSLLKGYSRWSLRLLSEKIVELRYVDSLSHVMVRRVLKNELKPWKSHCWVISPKQNSAFVAAKEQVLDA
ncbi:MAG: helix-turn-helix domain-containing protein [Gracilimonas sp.]|nr:helix-turn-helix domain-containing protein [Gracilimonas sp.]